MLTRGESGGSDSAMLLRNTSVAPSESDREAPPDVVSYVLFERLFEPLVSSMRRENISKCVVWRGFQLRFVTSKVKI